jgi:Uma2 family endonuclease
VCEPNYEHLITEDHKPVERILIEKLYRLLTEPLYVNWPGPGPGRSFLVLANVGYFYEPRTPAVSPDCLLSLDVSCPEDLHSKQGHSYYQWRMKKPPEVIIEVVSDRKGGEDGFKRNLYARLKVPYYVIYDPDHYLSKETLQTYVLRRGAYRATDAGPWPTVGLGLRLWQGRFEGVEETWLRWCDANGVIIPTGEERTAQERERADREADRASEAETRASREKARARREKDRANREADRANREKDRADRAEGRIRELEEKLRRSNDERPPHPGGG